MWAVAMQDIISVTVSSNTNIRNYLHLLTYIYIYIVHNTRKCIFLTKLHIKSVAW